MTVARRHRVAATALALGLAIAGLAGRLSPLPGPPLYDGVVQAEPYVWLDPPPDHPGHPQGAGATLPTPGGKSPLIVIATPENVPQAALYAIPDALTLPPGTTSVKVSIDAVEPAAQPTDGHIAGNVYRILVANQTGAAATTPASAKTSIVLEAPDPTATNLTVEELLGGGWQPLQQQSGGLGGTFQGVVTTFGDFALIAPGPAASVAPSIVAGAPGGETLAPVTPPPADVPVPATGVPTITIFAGVALALVVVGLVAIAVLPGRRRPPSGRGWGDPPRRGRR